MSEAKDQLIQALWKAVITPQLSKQIADAIEALALKIAAEVAEKHIAAERQRNRPMWDCSDAECERQMAEAAKAEPPAGGQRRCDHKEPDMDCFLCRHEALSEPQPPTPTSAGPIGLHEDFLRFCEQRQSSDMQALVAEIRRLKALNTSAPAEGGRDALEHFEQSIRRIVDHSVGLNRDSVIDCIIGALEKLDAARAAEGKGL